MAIVLPLPRTAVLVGLAVMLTFVALASFWAPGMAMLSDAAEDAGLDQALAFAISNLAWALGHMFGAGVGGAVADATTRRGALRGARRAVRDDARRANGWAGVVSEALSA